MNSYIITLIKAKEMVGLLGFYSTIFAKADKWINKADTPTGRCYLATSAVNGKIYAIGGGDAGGILSTVEEYDTGFTGESVEAKGKLPTEWGQLKNK